MTGDLLIVILYDLTTLYFLAAIDDYLFSFIRDLLYGKCSN